MRKAALFLLLFLMASWPMLAQGPVKFYASSDAKQIVLGSYFELQFVLENADGTDFNPPQFKNFSVLSGPNQSNSITSVNGKWSRTIGFSYNLQPRSVGKFTIPSATVKVKGKVLKSNPIQLEVVKGKNSTASTQADLQAQIEEQVFIKAEPNKTEALIGEQILLDYKLYTTRDIENYHIITESDYPGFFVQDIRRSGTNRVVKEVIDGVQYSTKVLKRVSLFPQQAGRLDIESLELQVAVIVEDGRRRRRGFFYTPNVNRIVLRTEPTPLSIKKLPDGSPPTFTGAVGKYYMIVNTNRTSLSTDDAITLQMTITGNGDVKRILAPPLMLSDTFEVYEPRIIEESSFESSGQITGKKTIEYLILPKLPGQYELRPTFTYYDIDSLKYVDLQPKVFKVAVSKGSVGTADLNKRPKAVEQKEDIRFIKTSSSFQQEGEGLYGTPLFWSLFLFPFLALGGLVVFRQIQNSRNNIDGNILRQRRAQKQAQKRLKQAKTYLDQQNSKSFYDEISRASFGYVCDKLQIPFSELSKQNVRFRLESLEVGESLIARFLSIIQTCEMALFAGKDNAAAMNETYQNTLDVVAGMEEAIILKKEE
ncbi:MAG: BatD family protein [Bacteroidota bacterium]